MTVLITGGSGRLGKELKKVYPEVYAPSHYELDITNKNNVKRFLKQVKPSLIIHAAALTSVEQCETNSALAFKVNVIGTQNLIEQCRNALFVYVSSACVFKGDKGNYSENDGPDPRNVYGLTKFLAELSVATSCDDYLIARTNFVARQKWPYPRAFVDRFGTYLYADQVAKAIKELVNKGVRGTVHVCGDKKFSMFELAKFTTPNVKPMRLSDYKGKAKLTKDMSLVSVKIKHYSLLGDA